MYKKKAFKYFSKKNYKISVFVSLLPLAKKIFSHFVNQLVAITLCIIFCFVTIATANTAFGEEETAVYSSHKHLSPYDYLEQHAELPVDFLFFAYLATDELQNKFPEIAHPFFLTVKHEKKIHLQRKSLISPSKPNDLNSIITHHTGIDYIDRKLLVSTVNIPLYQWLLSKYGSVFHRNNSATSLLTITVAGMLFDLQQSAENGDAAAKLVLAFLKRPYVKTTPSGSTEHQSFFSTYTQYLKQLFFQTKEPSFSEQLAKLKDSAYTDGKSRYQRLSALKKYQYQKNYTFISYETDENGKPVLVSSDDIILTDQEMQKVLRTGDSALNHATDLPEGTSAITNIAGMKFISQTANQISTLLVSGLLFFSMINTGQTSPVPTQCEKGNCSAQNYHFLSNNNFITALEQNATGRFKLAEDITLNDRPGLPVFQHCNQPFSGVFETGNHTMHAGNGTSPLFGCIDQAHISGNFDSCPTGLMSAHPIIANQVHSESIVNVTHHAQCNMQRPMFGNVTGDNNQIIFTGTSEEVIATNKTGIIAENVSGNSNIITVKGTQLVDTPVVSVSGGNHNTYRQKNMNITRHTENHHPDNKLLVTNQFIGDNTTITQNDIRATFITSATNSNTLNRKMADNQNSTITTFSSNAIVKIHPPEESVRITNISNSSTQRPVVVNYGRAEIYRNGSWKAICNDTLDAKTANVACKSLGYEGANNAEQRLRLKDTLSSVKLNTPPVHTDKQCTGHEKHLSQCNATTTAVNTPCLQEREAFLACFDNPADNNTVLLSHDSTERPLVQEKPCSQSGQASGTTIFYAGKFDWTTDCQPNRCPVTYWDADGVQAVDTFQQQCDSMQRLHTTYSEDALKMWNLWCKSKSDGCSCHLPNEQLLGIVLQNNPNETLLVAHQSYPYNDNADEQGLIRVSRLFSKEAPQLLHPVNETLVTGAFPVNQVITKQHLLGLYSGATKGESVQLLWSSLAEDNNVYHAQTIPVDGKPLLLTTDSVFIKNTANTTIAQYPLNITTHDNNIASVTFDSHNAPYKNIAFPENMTDILTATVKNGLLYVAATHDANADQAYIMRYNISTESWDPTWQQGFSFDRSINYKIAISDDGQIQILLPEQILSPHPVSISIPDEGGCALFSSGKVLPEEAMVSEPEATVTTPDITENLPTKPAPTNKFDDPHKVGRITIASLAVFLITGVGAFGGLALYCHIKGKSHIPNTRSPHYLESMGY